MALISCTSRCLHADELSSATWKIESSTLSTGASAVDGTNHTADSASYRSFHAAHGPLSAELTSASYRSNNGMLPTIRLVRPSTLFANDSTTGAQTGQASPVLNLNDLTPALSAIHTDYSLAPEAATGYKILVSTDNTFASVTHWDSGIVAFGANVAHGARCADIAYAGTALSWGTTYFWRVSFRNANGFIGPWSPTAQFTTLAALNITTASLPNGVVNSAYSQTLAVTGGQTPFSWALSAGSLPPGLTLGAGAGTISGTPTAAGTYNFTAQATDSSSRLSWTPRRFRSLSPRT
ncbi:MAG: putative Ig domain-containing protein [Planctomycetes bacterium]|nr:putative Ig domain-containing protein [Planctomycetota bacterium]